MNSTKKTVTDNASPNDTEKGVSLPQSSVREWLAVVSVALGAFTFVITEFLPIGVLPQVARDLGISTGTAGLMVTVPGIVAALAAPIVLIAAGRVDRRQLLLMLTALLVAANVVAALASNLPTMLVARGLFGAGLGAFWTLALTVGRRLVREVAATRAMASSLPAYRWQPF